MGTRNWKFATLPSHLLRFRRDRVKGAAEPGGRRPVGQLPNRPIGANLGGNFGGTYLFCAVSPAAFRNARRSRICSLVRRFSNLGLGRGSAGRYLGLIEIESVNAGVFQKFFHPRAWHPYYITACHTDAATACSLIVAPVLVEDRDRLSAIGK